MYNHRGNENLINSRVGELQRRYGGGVCRNIVNFPKASMMRGQEGFLRRGHVIQLLHSESLPLVTKVKCKVHCIQYDGRGGHGVRP